MRLLILLCVLSLSATASAKRHRASAKQAPVPQSLTKEDLLAGSKIPVKRDFQLSDSISACEDFHRYVCDKAETSFKLPKDRSTWIFSFSDSSERLLYAKKNFFNKLSAGYQPKLERTKNLARVYKACMNQSERKKEEVEFVKNTLRRVGSASDLASLKKIVNENLLTPHFSAVGTFEIANQENPVRNDLAFVADGMTLPEKSYYEEKEPVEDLRNLARTLFQDINLDRAKERADAVVEFEKGLADVYPTPADLRKLFSENTYQKPEQWQKQYPNIDFQSVFSKVPGSTLFRNITKDAFGYLNEYLNKATPFQLQSVLIFQEFYDLMDDAYPKYYKTYFEFQKKHRGGPDERPARNERCTKYAMGSFGMELDAELIPVLFPGFDGAKVIETAEAVRATIIKGLDRNKWLSSSARKEAINKIKSASLKLIKPTKEADWNFLDVKELSDNKPIENMIAVEEAQIARMLKKVKEDRNRDEWGMSPLSVNAYYSAEDNQFVLLQGILQYPFFDANQTRVENVGAMGMVVGHELGHGVDDEGSKYDAKGQLRQWMKKSDLEEFNSRGKKLIDQFNNIGHDGRLTLGENIGDNVGLQFALETAFPDQDAASMDDVRKFFISYGRLWCGVMKPSARKMQLKTNPHALPEARINQQVVHKDLFYKAFSCKAGDKMYLDPKDRVQIW